MYPQINSKYGNKRVVIDGIKFHSKKEGRRYLELKMLQGAGEIQDLELQPSFELQKKFTHKGTNYRNIRYVADFRYKENGEVIVEDVKSSGTKKLLHYTMKKKMLLYQNPDINFLET